MASSDSVSRATFSFKSFSPQNQAYDSLHLKKSFWQKAGSVCRHSIDAELHGASDAAAKSGALTFVLGRKRPKTEKSEFSESRVFRHSLSVQSLNAAQNDPKLSPRRELSRKKKYAPNGLPGTEQCGQTSGNP